MNLWKLKIDVHHESLKAGDEIEGEQIENSNVVILRLPNGKGAAFTLDALELIGPAPKLKDEPAGDAAPVEA